MGEEEIKKEPECPRCKRKYNLYFRVDGSLFCRSCGYNSKKDKENKE